MGMFCFQCQETAGGKGCTVRGVCGKTEDVAKLQDLLVYVVKGVSELAVKGEFPVPDDVTREILNSLFMTITNANFDGAALESQIRKMITLRDRLGSGVSVTGLHRAALFESASTADMLSAASDIGVLSEKNEDIRSLREMIVYGIKGMAAYTEHAAHLGKNDPAIHTFIRKALAATLDETLSADDLTALVLETGEYGIKAMALLDDANTSRYGNPEITQVHTGVRKNPAILISGHDLKDLEQLLDQTQNTGIDVYTHGEMLPAHYYPFFKKYTNFAGNYGNAWWQQLSEFESFHGPILFTTNCIVPPKSEEIRNRIFTTGAAGYPGCTHIIAGPDEKKDFSSVIDLARTLQPPQELENGTITGGFAHNQVALLADKVVEAVKSGAIKKFFVMAGCDGRMKSREYYTEFARKLPTDTVILTAGCAKYRYNKLNLGSIGGIPRVLDAGQCNDSYSLVLTALKLKEAFGLDDINKLPIVYNIAWYEQKAVIVLLALLYLGVKNIHLGPSLPGFLSPNIASVLVEKFGIGGIDSVDKDIARFTA